jgi:hypothetical protein
MARVFEKKKMISPLTDGADAMKRLQQVIGPPLLYEYCNRLVYHEEGIRKEISEWGCMDNMYTSFGNPDAMLPTYPN